jgi:hypothetical protein
MSATGRPFSDGAGHIPDNARPPRSNGASPRCSVSVHRQLFPYEPRRSFCLEATVRVEIRAAPENARSRAIPERLGFTQEGTLRQVERVGDRYLDNVVYAMLAEDWKG